MKTANIQLAGSVLTRDPTNYANRDQQFTNCFSYAVGDEITGGRRIYTEKRRGYTRSNVSGMIEAKRGACVWKSNSTSPPPLVFSFTNGSTTLRIYLDSGTQVGADLTASDCSSITDTDISGTGNLVAIIQNGSNLEGWYFPQAGAWTQITDGQFPPNNGLTLSGSPVHLDGYMFVMCTNGQIWNSDLNSLSSWSANNFITANSSPDRGVGLARTKDIIVAFGLKTIQFYVNNGNPSGSPLLEIPNSVIRVGCYGAYTIKTIGDIVYFAGVNPETGQYGIYQLNGTELKKISTPDIEMFPQGVPPACIGAFRTSLGYDHVLFDSPSAATPMSVYCSTNNRWWRMTTADSTVIRASLGKTYAGSGAYYFAGHIGTASAGIYAMDPTGTVFQDNGTNVAMTIQTQPLDFGTGKYKYPAQVRLFGDKQSSTCNVAMSYSDDDAITFSTPVNMDMSTNSPAVFNPLGRFRRRVWKFTNAVNLPLRLERFEVDYEVGLT